MMQMGMHGGPGGFQMGGGPGGMQNMQGLMDDEDSRALMEEAREWIGDKVDQMGPQEGQEGGGNPMDQLPKPKTRRITIDSSKGCKLDQDDAIAIVGIGGKFPGAETVDYFWRVLLNGENHVVEIPPERWNVEEYYSADYDEPGKTYVRRAGFIQNFDEFDAKMFGISEPEAAKMDPQQRYVLECVHMALEDGGIMRKDLFGSKTGVYMGVMNDDYKSSATEDPAVASNYTLTGTAPSIIAARVSYVYNLLGPSMSIDTACSSSLVAIHLASQALKSGDCNMAICGGVNSILYPDILIPLAKARMVSPTGQCQAFSDTADGYIRGEGGGVVVLKRLKQAREDGNKIWATISTACNQDGRTMTPITAPSVQMQTELLEEVYESSNVNPGLVQYIEAHGTGTPVGDPIEANSLGEFFNAYRDPELDPLRIGSVKTNIGHLESAAGVAGIVKVLLMMKHGKTVKSLHFERPNPKIDFPKYNMAVCIDVDDWPVMEDGTRMSCVNSFGFGGTNSHAIIKQFPQDDVEDDDEETGSRKYIIVLSALDNGGLANSLKHFVHCLTDTSEDSLKSIAYTSTCRREHFKYRLAFVAETRDELKQKAEKELKTIEDVRPPGLNPPNIVFVFCGVGTTWTGMCKELLEKDDVFSDAVKEVDGYLKQYADWSIYEKLKEEADLSDPLLGHIAIFTCQIALTKLWRHYGIEPNAVLGQSVGEVAAAYASGALSLENAVKVIYHRSYILSKATGGSMFVVGNSSTERVEELCKEYEDRINIAVYNSSKSCTVSGDTDVVNEVMEKLKKESEENNDQIFLRSLNVKCAYHSCHTEKASIELENELKDLEGSTPSCKLVSTATGDVVGEQDFVTAAYWKDNVRKPVLFQKAVKKASIGNTLNIYVELGPKPVLKAHLSDSFAPGKAISLPSMNVNLEEACIFESLAAFYMNGVTPEMEKINPFTSIISDIPKYIPNRMKSLFEADSTVLRKQGRNKMSSTHPFVKRQSDDNTPFKIDISTTSTPYVYEHNVAGNILVPGAFYAEVSIEASKQLLNQSPFDLEISVDFLRPLRLSPGSPCEAFFMLKSISESDNLTFTIQTGNDIIARGKSAKIVEDIRLNLVDVQKIRERCHVYHSKEKTYETLKTLGFVYGEDLQILGDGVKNRTECLVDVTLSELLMKDLVTTNIHPAVLDGLLQTPGIIQDMMEERPSGQLLPAGFSKLILRRTPEKNMLAYMHLKSFSKDEIIYNLLLLQTDGVVVAEVKDFVIRAIEKTEVSFANVAHKIVWTEIEASRLTPNSSSMLSIDTELPLSIINKNDKQLYIDENKTDLKKDVKIIEIEDDEKSSSSSSSVNEKWDKKKAENEKGKIETSSNTSLEKIDTPKSETPEEIKPRTFVLITREKETADSFKVMAANQLDIRYHVIEDLASLKEDVLEKHFGTGQCSGSETNEICLIYATGKMKNYESDGKQLFEDLVAESEMLISILQFMADKPEPNPMYIFTQSTQSVTGESHMNLRGSELWGMVRSALREQSFKIYLVDIDPDFKPCMKQLLQILSGMKQLALPELAVRNNIIYENEFITQPDTERNRQRKLNSFDEHCVIEYRSMLPDDLKDTFYSLQEADKDDQGGMITMNISQACLHDRALYPLTFEKAVDALNLWSHEHGDGYGVLSFEAVGEKVENKTKNKNGNIFKKKYVSCFPMKVQSTVMVPKSCTVCLSDLPTYVPGMLRTTTLLWRLVDKLPSRKSYCIITDTAHYITALILKELISSRRSGPVVVYKMEELMSPEQILDVLIPITKIDLKTAHHLVESSENITMIASLRHFLPLSIERYITARSPDIKVIAADTDRVLTKPKLLQIVPSVIKWLKKQKHNMIPKELLSSSVTGAVFGLPSKVVELDPNIDINEVKIPDSLVFRKTAVYIIVGGMTGLGWEITKYLAEKGAGFIISLSRREPAPEKQTEIGELSARFGCYISTAQTDITDIFSLQETFEEILTEIQYPIKGIFQGAGVLDDALFVSMTKEKLQKVFMPKVLGSWNLHLVSENLDLDYFVMHSSMTSVFGNAGQTNYGAANAFIDALAHYRRNLGLSAQSINWGPLKVGMAMGNDSLEEILQRRGLFSLNVTVIKKCLLEILKNNTPQVTYGVFDWDVIASGLESDEMFLVQYRFRGYVDKILEQRRAKRNAVQLNFDLNEIMSIPKEERMDAIIKALQILASEVFGVELSLLNEETLISALGVDSMLAMTFAQTVLKVMHVKISLVMLLTDGTTILSLAESVNEILENGGGAQPIQKKEIDESVYGSMTPYEKRAYNGHCRNKYDPSLYMFGDVIVDSVIAMPEYWTPLIENVHKKYPALRTLFIPGHDDIRYGVKRVIMNPEDVQIDFRIVPKALLQHKTRHPPNVDDYLFDPAQDLPMRVFYAKKGRNAIMRFLFNHLALDLQSISVIMNDLTPNASTEPLDESIDIAAHIERRLIDDDKELREFWEASIPKSLQPMSLTQTGEIDTDPNFFEFTRIRVPDELFQGLKQILQPARVTLFQFFTTMFEIMLHVELRQPTVAIMTTIDCRMFFPDLKKECNRFTNRIPLFLELSDNSVSVMDILQENKVSIMESMERGYMPFLDIISKVDSYPVNEIFRHQIVMEETAKISSLTIKNGKRAPLRIKKLQVGNYYNETIFYVWNDEVMKKLDLELGCSTLIIDEDRAANLLNLMIMMTERFVANPNLTLLQMTSYSVSSIPEEVKDLNSSTNKFTKQTMKGWDHEIYLELGTNDENMLKWGSHPLKMTRRLPYSDIVDITLGDMADEKALILSTQSRKYVFRTNKKNQAIQWWMSIREKVAPPRPVPLAEITPL